MLIKNYFIALCACLSLSVSYPSFILFNMNRPDSKGSNLWNVLEVDDPYDIKKSMIARLPDHPSIPMGRNLELVCLLQAAQIERLSTYLVQMQSKYRQVQRKQLDRHSYQVQIKELVEKQANHSSLKSQNQKLKQFIRRQSSQLQSMQSRHMQSVNFETLQAKYQNLLGELGIARQQKEHSQQSTLRLQQTNFQLQVELDSFRNRFDNMQKQYSVWSVKYQRVEQDRISIQTQMNQRLNEKNRQIQYLNGMIGQKNQQLQQSMINVKNVGEEIKQLSLKYSCVEEQNSVLLSDFQSIKQQNNSLIAKCEALQDQRMRLYSQNRQLDIYEEKTALLSLQIQRLMGVIQKKSSQNEIMVSQVRNLSIQVQTHKSISQQLTSQQQKSLQTQQRVRHLQMEVSHLQQQIQTCRGLEEKMDEQIHRLQGVIRQKEQMISNLNQRLRQGELSSQQMAAIATEKARLQQQLQASRTQYRNFKTITQGQISTLKKETAKLHSDLQLQGSSQRMVEQFKIQCQRLRTQNQQYKRQQDNIRAILQQLKSRVNTLAIQKTTVAKQNQKLRSQLMILKRQMEAFKIQLMQGEDKDRIIDQMQAQINAQRQRGGRLEVEVSQLQKKNTKLMETVDNIYQEIQRLHQMLTQKTSEEQRARSQLRIIQQKWSIFQAKQSNSSKQKQHYQQMLRNAQQLNRRLKQQYDLTIRTKQQLQSKVLILQQKSHQLMEEITRLQQIVIKKEEISASIARQRQQAQRMIADLQRQLAVQVATQQQLRKDQMNSANELRNRQTAYSHLEITLRQTQQQLAQLQNQTRNNQQSGSHWQQLYLQAQLQLKTKDQQILSMRQNHQRLAGQFRTLHQQITVVRDGKQKQSEDQILQLRAQLQQADAHIARLKEQIVQVNRRWELCQESIKEYQMKIVHIQNTHTLVLQERLKQHDQRGIQRQNMIGILQRKNAQLQRDMEEYLRSDRSTIQHLQGYQQKISMLSMQLDRLKIVIQDKTRSNQQKDQTIRQLQMRLSQQVNTSQVQQLRGYQIQINNLKNIVNELQSINMHTLAQRDQLFKVSHQIQHKLDQHMLKIKNIQSSQHSTGSQLRRQEIEQFRHKQLSYVHRIQQLQRVLADKQKGIEQIRIQMRGLTIQNTNLTNLIQQMQRRQQQHPVGLSRQDITKITIRLKQTQTAIQGKDRLIVQWQTKYSSLYSAYQQLYNNYNATKQEYQNTLVNVKNYEAKFYKFQQDLESLTIALKNTKAQLEKYKQQNYTLKTQAQGSGQLYQKNLILSKQIDRLTQLNSSLSQQVSQLRLRSTDNVSLSKRVQEHLALFVVLFAEVESLRGRLLSMGRQCQQVRRSSIMPYRMDRSSSSHRI